MTALAVTAASTASPARRGHQTSVSTGISLVSTGDYKPIEPKTLDEIPKKIRERLRAHLLERLGESYLAKLSFAGGQIVDFDDLYREEPNAKNYQWTVFAYRLVFRITAPEKGIAEYCAAIELDKAGAVIREIELPPVRRSPVKANFIPLAQAYALAARNGFNVDETSADITYDPKIESLVYRLRQTVEYRPPSGTDRVIEVNAHTGRVVSIHDSTWIE